MVSKFRFGETHFFFAFYFFSLAHEKQTDGLQAFIGGGVESAMWAGEGGSLEGVEFATTVIINPLTALRMLENFANLSPVMLLCKVGCIIQLTRICGIHNINIIRDKVGSN